VRERGPAHADGVATERTPRVVAARRLLRRVARDRDGRFLVEGAQAVREALRWAGEDPARMPELFATVSAAGRHPQLLDAAPGRVTVVTDRAAQALSDTVTPQGLVAVCALVEVSLATALAGGPSLVTVLAGVADPGNVGAVIRVADAAGADAVLLAGETVDPHNGKAVRASTGSLFHVPVARDPDAVAVLEACRARGLTVVVADGRGELDLHGPDAAAVLAGGTAWVFGSEAHGVSPELAGRADHRLRIPIHGRAESLNLASAAAVCLYASASYLRRS